MKIKKISLYKKIEAACREFEQEFDLITEERKEKLLLLSNYIVQKIEKKQTPGLVVICTHNSRRSHIGQLWLAVGADYFQLPEIQTFSGGTEVTAFNIRAIKSLQRLGFRVSTKEEHKDNPIFNISWKEDMKPYQAFSKKYEDKPNPRDKFAAIMVCSQADKGCPFVTGCDFRLSLPYDDPKYFDGTASEAIQYDERVRQMGREILYALSQVNEE